MPAKRKDLNTSKGCKMSAAHFRVIASIIRRMPDHAPALRAQKMSTARAFAQGLRATNPAFDADRFEAACIEGMPIPFDCPKCGQHIDDGQPCGCGARSL